MIKNVVLSSLILIFVFVHNTHAWGTEGHQAVASIATKFLSTTSLNALDEILNGASLTSIASWADEVKHSAAYRWSSSLHYINTADFECGFNRSTDCPDNWCLAGAIDNYTSLITAGNDLNEAVKFLVHFMGDLAQPLHVGFGSDEGGNTLHGTLQGKRENLHSIWDSVIISERISNDFSDDFSEFTNYLIARVSVGGDLVNKVSAITSCTSDCVDVWASESAANNCAYVYVDDNGNEVTDGFTLGDSYYQKSVQHVEYLLIEGGVRLAYVLNNALSKADYAMVS